MGQITKGVLYFKSNNTTPEEEIEYELVKSGFKSMLLVEFCDDCMPDNTRRPLHIDEM